MNAKAPKRSRREAAIARRAAQVPSSFLANYVKATNGEASPREAIRSFCCECCGWERQEVALCTATACPLWMYRPYVAVQ